MILMLRNTGIMLLVGLISGCASIVSGSTQSVAILPMQEGVIATNVTCTATNRKGSWVTSGGGSVTVKKSSDDLRVTCTDPETDAIATSAGPKTTQVGWAVANFFIWDLCTISCIIDFSNGAIYEYPTQVQLYMPKMHAGRDTFGRDQRRTPD